MEAGTPGRNDLQPKMGGVEIGDGDEGRRWGRRRASRVYLCSTVLRG